MADSFCGTLFSSLSASLPPNLKHCLDLASEKGASSWLTALPLECHGFVLHKGAFRDAIALRYGWPPPHRPSHCVCGKSNSIEHALSCSNGAFPSIHHNEIQDVIAALLSEACHDVSTEPSLQPLSGESLSLASANTELGGHLDIKASGFWGWLLSIYSTPLPLPASLTLIASMGLPSVASRKNM